MVSLHGANGDTLYPAPTSTPGPTRLADFATAVEYADVNNKPPALVGASIPVTVSTATERPKVLGFGVPTDTAVSPASKAGRSESDSPSPTSKPAVRRSPGSTKHWRTPKNARQLAAQMNNVATMLLNGEINREVAHQYTQMMRPTVQAMSAVVYQARAEKVVPDLSLDDEDLFDEVE